MQILKQTIQCVIALLFFSSPLFAQKKIIVEGSKDQPYFQYVVRNGESLSSIAKTFQTDVPSLMKVNNFNNKSKLAFGKPIKVPFNPTILSQQENASALPTAVIHKVAKGENLYRISVNHNKVDMELLKKWNRLAANAMLDDGQEIIVGYVNFKNIAVDPKKEAVAEVKPSPKKESNAEELYTAPAEKKEEKQTAETKKEEQKEIKQEEPKQENQTAVAPRVTNAAKVESAATEPKADTQNISAEGFFANVFGKNVEGRELQTRTGTAMTFKTASGWTDKKYYILINDVPPGSVVKISNGGSKVVYAKVLWGLGGIKENEGLEFRISNAAAAVLGISDAKFPLIVTFYE